MTMNLPAFSGTKWNTGSSQTGIRTLPQQHLYSISSKDGQGHRLRRIHFGGWVRTTKNRTISLISSYRQYFLGKNKKYFPVRNIMEMVR